MIIFHNFRVNSNSYISEKEFLQTLRQTILLLYLLLKRMESLKKGTYYHQHSPINIFADIRISYGNLEQKIQLVSEKKRKLCTHIF